jgi:enoyl-[acyl-carrier protein] reductase II
VRVLRTELSESYEFDIERNAMEAMSRHRDLYFEGDLSAGLPFAGQVAGRIDAIRPVAEVVAECARECLTVLHDLAARYPARR